MRAQVILNVKTIIKIQIKKIQLDFLAEPLTVIVKLSITSWPLKLVTICCN